MEEEIIEQGKRKIEGKTVLLSIIAIILAGILFSLVNNSIAGNIISSKDIQVSTLDKVKERGDLRVGYAVYPPYAEKDVVTGEPYGYSIDIAKEIASQMNVDIVFIEGSWQTYTADLQNDKYDLLIGPLFSSIERGKNVDFAEPIGYFSVLAALVKNNDNRFKTIDDLNKKGVTIAVPQGWTAHEYAMQYLTNATIKPFKTETAALALSDVVTGNSDIALADGPSVQQYLEKNPNQPVKALFLDNPVVIAPAGFGIKKGDFEWARFLDLVVEDLRAEGKLHNIAENYHLYSYEIKREYIPQ